MRTLKHSHAVWPMVISDHGETLPHGMVMAAIANRYRKLLLQHLSNPSEVTLLAAYEMGKEMVRVDLTPEEAMAFHIQAVDHAENSVSSEANRLLMEVMTAFGGAFRAMRAGLQADEKMRRSYTKLKHALGDTIEAINAIRETRDPQTVAHQRRVAQLAVAIAERLGLDDDRVEGLRVAASLHDVGMMQVPTDALAKPGKLAPDEFSMVKVHPEVGYDMLKDIESPWPIAEIARQHHERMDGLGYPFGLRGDEILLESRVISVADTIEAMVSQRPYRAPLDIESALEEVRAGRGSHFDPMVVDACLEIFSQQHFTFH